MEKIKTYNYLLEKIKNEGCSVCEADFPKIKELVNLLMKIIILLIIFKLMKYLKQ